MTTPEPQAPNPAAGPGVHLQAIVGLGAIQALTMLAGLSRTKILALLLGPEGVGIANVVDQTTALIVHLGTLSLPLVGLKFLSRTRADGSAAFATLYRAMLALLTVAAVAGTTLAVGVALWRPGALAAELAPYRWVLVTALLAAPALSIAAFLRSVLAATDRNREAALFGLFGGIGLVGSAYAGVRAGGLTGLYVANLAIHLGLAVAMLAFVRTIRGAAPRLTLRDTVAELRAQPGLGRFVAGFHLLSLTSPVAYLMARVQIIHTDGARGVGLFAAAYGLAVAMRVVLNQANGLYLMPIVNRTDPKAERASASADYLRVLVVVLVLAALAIVLFGREWIILLYAREFAPAHTLVGAFVAGEALLLLAGVYQALLIGFDDLRAHMVVSTVANTVVAAGAWMMVPPFGPVGAAYAFLAAHGIILLASAWRLRVTHQALAVTRPIAQALVAVAVVFAAGYWASHAGPRVAWKLAAYAAAAGVFLGRLSAAERRWLLTPWRRPGP